MVGDFVVVVWCTDDGRVVEYVCVVMLVLCMF